MEDEVRVRELLLGDQRLGQATSGEPQVVAPAHEQQLGALAHGHAADGQRHEKTEGAPENDAVSTDCITGE